MPPGSSWYNAGLRKRRARDREPEPEREEGNSGADGNAARRGVDRRMHLNAGTEAARCERIGRRFTEMEASQPHDERLLEGDIRTVGVEPKPAKQAKQAAQPVASRSEPAVSASRRGSDFSAATSPRNVRERSRPARPPVASGWSREPGLKGPRRKVLSFAVAIVFDQVS